MGLRQFSTKTAIVTALGATFLVGAGAGLWLRSWHVCYSLPASHDVQSMRVLQYCDIHSRKVFPAFDVPEGYYSGVLDALSTGRFDREPRKWTSFGCVEICLSGNERRELEICRNGFVIRGPKADSYYHGGDTRRLGEVLSEACHAAGRRPRED